MKVLDPQAALITNAEVFHFLKANPLRKPEKKSGAYEPVNLSDAANVRKDFNSYIDLTSPHIKQYPTNDEFITTVVRRLRRYGLTKTEVLSLINLGLGLSRTQPANANVVISTDVPGETEAVKDETEGTDPTTKDHAPAADATITPADDENAVEPNFRALAACVVEDIGERFPGEKGEEKIEEILGVLRECIDSVSNG